MIAGRRVLAVVPARSGSKGVRDKNIRRLGGLSLIGWAGRLLARVDWVDARIISTDSAAYAAEGARHGLEAPFLRPAELSSDTATAVDTMTHAMVEMDARTGQRFDLLLVIEPTSPLRLPDDLRRTVGPVVRDGCDSALAVSRLDPKWHPRKALRIVGDRVTSFIHDDEPVSARQALDDLYWRNGVCYAVTRRCLVEDRRIIGRDCAAVLIDHPVVNIDAEWELAWAEFLLARDGAPFRDLVTGA